MRTVSYRLDPNAAPLGSMTWCNAASVAVRVAWTRYMGYSQMAPSGPATTVSARLGEWLA